MPSERTGTVVVRIYPRGGQYPTTWRAFRFDGPFPGARFDDHVSGERRGVLYAARDLTTCVAEIFQGSRVVDRFADDRCLAAFRLTRAVRLLDLTGDWPTRAAAPASEEPMRWFGSPTPWTYGVRIGASTRCDDSPHEVAERAGG